ncbi:putative acyl-CoA synthetase YngI [Ceratocystis platani]|uniref:Putative acyl-CoA synthetase YngI n=1 Tax=Ceratocystis fimbriata f. sp. platani TaxID=88771 RepID=A0A0F8B4D5_CERFI|nr:putative acyl-CoA synthetase YngI [Ceratocystis platani]
MKGYWRDQEKTDQVRVVDDNGVVWMHSGDEAEMDEEGFVKITGRIKDLIIRGGENIYPLEIENCLIQHPKIVDASVVGVPDDKYGESVAAFIIAKSSIKASNQIPKIKEITKEEVKGHEILTSTQLAATVNTKACMSRKSISEVDINLAVKKILDPGAPLALRLQSNLLSFGWLALQMLKIIWLIPVLSVHRPSQGHIFRTSSHMSPTSSTPKSQKGNGSHGSSIFLDISQSPDRNSLMLPLDLGGSPVQKPGTIRIQGDDDLMPLEDLGLDLDFGLDVNPEPIRVNDIDTSMFEDLPKHAESKVNKKDCQTDQDGDALMLDDVLGLIPEEAPLPKAEAFASAEGGKEKIIAISVEGDQRNETALMRRTRAPNHVSLLDEDTRLHMDSIRAMSQNYLDIQEDLTVKKKRRMVARNSKANALKFVFGHGIGHVGSVDSMSHHPLSSAFSGVTFAANILNRIVPPSSDERSGDKVRHQEKNPNNSNDGDVEAEDARRARAHLSHDIDVISAHDERSRRNTPVVEDHMGSSFAPWARGGSTAPNSAKSARFTHSRLQSPLGGNVLQDIEHLSSEVGQTMLDYDLLDVGVMGLGDGVGPPAISGEVTKFREYIHGQVRQHMASFGGSATSLKRGGGGRKPMQDEMVWLDFRDFAGPGQVSRGEAARAFLNVLTLATKNECKIRTEYLPAEDNSLLGTHIIEVGFDSVNTHRKKTEEASDILAQ